MTSDSEHPPVGAPPSSTPATSRTDGQPGLVLFGGTLQQIVEIGRKVDSSSFASMYLADFYDRSAVVGAAAVISATRRIRVGTAIAYAVGRSPLVLAAEARDLNELAGGRFALGLGLGTRTMQRDWHGADPASPAPRMEELVPLLRQIWAMDSEGVDHAGRFYELHLRPTVEVRPQTHSLPIYMAAVNRRMVEAAGKVADGCITHPLCTQRYVDEVVRPALAVGARTAGRDDRTSTVGYVLCSIAETRAVAIREVKAQLAFYAIVKTYDAILDLHGFADAAVAMRAAWRRGDVNGMIDAVPDAMVEAMAVAGTPDEVTAQLADRFPSAYDETLLYPPAFAVDEGRWLENIDAMIDTFGRSSAS